MPEYNGLLDEDCLNFLITSIALCLQYIGNYHAELGHLIKNILPHSILI
jgi:hypothetical protein